MPDTDERTPEQWRDLLLKKLDARQHDIRRAHDYYDGRHDCPPLPHECGNDLKALAGQCTLNLCALVVDAAIERLAVQGFQFGTPGEDSDADEERVDAVDVWRQVWQRNRLDADSDLVHIEALIARRAFVSVWPTDDGKDVDIFPESPAEVYVDYEPGRRRKRRAAVKRFTEGEGSSTVTDITLFVREGGVLQVYRWHGQGKTPPLDETESGPAPASLGNEIPFIEFIANPDLSGVPHGELDRGVLEVQDRVNKTVFDRLVTSEFLAFPQRYALGVDVETDDDGNAVSPIKVGPNRVFVNENEKAVVGQWDAADMGPHLKAVDADIHAIAAMTKTPVYYLAAQFSNVSADAIRAAEAGLVKKVQRHQRVFGESWEEVIRLALKVKGDARANDLSSVIEWADAETRTVAELADAVLKLKEVLPKPELHRMLGYSPQERAQFATDALGDAMAARVAAQPAAAVA